MTMPAFPGVGVGRGAAPGKVILLGEHAVVYGRTALAAAIDRWVEACVERVDGATQFAAFAPLGNRAGRYEGSDRVGAPLTLPLSSSEERGPSPQDARFTQALARAAELLDIPTHPCAVTIRADLPVGVGLGSSAALSVALVRALSRWSARPLDDTSVCAYAFELERIFHGHPSGVDNTVATYGGLIAFRRGAATRPLVAAQPIPLVVALGHSPRRTQRIVAALRHRWERDAPAYEPLFDEIDWLVAAAEPAIARADLATLGGLLNSNHALLRRLGVSTEELDHMIGLARTAGAYGAKLTGGGGGGAVICVGDVERLVTAFRHGGWTTFVTEIGTRGIDAADSTNRMDHATLSA